MSQQKEATVDGQQSFSLSKRSFKRIDIRLLAWEEFVMLIRSGGSLDDIVTVNTKNKSDLYVKMKICGGLFILYLATKVGMLWTSMSYTERFSIACENWLTCWEVSDCLLKNNRSIIAPSDSLEQKWLLVSQHCDGVHSHFSFCFVCSDDCNEIYNVNTPFPAYETHQNVAFSLYHRFRLMRHKNVSVSHSVITYFKHTNNPCVQWGKSCLLVCHIIYLKSLMCSIKIRSTSFTIWK